MTRVLIADDHAVVRQGIQQFLAEEGDFSTGEARSAKETLDQVRLSEWDLVLLDIAMPDKSGIEVLRDIKRERPRLPVLMFSMYSDEEYAVSSLEAGAAGFVTKNSEPGELLQAIRRVVAGGRYVSPGFAEKLLEGVLPKRRLPHETLSQRERDVMLRISRGQSLTHIGEELHLSIKTVSTYRSRVLDKMNMSSNAEITRYVVEHHLDPQMPPAANRPRA